MLSSVGGWFRTTANRASGNRNREVAFASGVDGTASLHSGISGNSGQSRQAEIYHRSQSSIYTRNEMCLNEEKLVIAMVGLPARGKSYISKAIIRYLNFLGCRVAVFNAGNARRDAGQAGVDANFFDPSNEDAKKHREGLAMQCLENLLEFLHAENGCVSIGILDATNTTVERRANVHKRVAQEEGVTLLFVESLCSDEAILNINYRLKAANDDYSEMNSEKAKDDFLKRVEQYERAYEPVEDVEDGVAYSYIKMINAGRKLIKYTGDNETKEGVAPRLVFDLLHSLHLGPRSIFLVATAPSENDARAVVGGDTCLAELGRERAMALSTFIANFEDRECKPVTVLCGTSRRHKQTAAILNTHVPPVGSRLVVRVQRMNGLCTGNFDNLSYDEIEEKYPEEAASRRRDKLNYRYPGEGGESYQDLVARMHEHVLRLEQMHSSVLVLCDKQICRVLLAYFRGIPLKDMPYIQVPFQLMELARSHNGFEELLHPLPWLGGLRGFCKCTE